MSTEIAKTPSRALVGKLAAADTRRGREETAERSQRGHRLAVAAILGAFAVMLAWNVAHYPAGASTDSRAHFGYVETLREQHRLPTARESYQVHTPPLFHLAAAAIESSWETVTGAPGGERITHKVVQLFNVLLAVGAAFFVFLIARELFPTSWITQITALAFFALSPPVTRTAVMYHGQILATLLSTAALYVVVRAMVRRELTAKAGALAGILLGLGVVTRVFVLATVGAACLALAVHYAFTRRREVFGMMGVLILCVALLSTPWFISRQISEGNPLPLSCSSLSTAGCPLGRTQPKPDPPEPSPTVFTMPYRPGLLNSAPQIVYADWWGDYFLYYEIPSGLRAENAAGRLPDGRLPESYHRARVRQSYVGLVPTLLMLAGLLGLIWEGARRRKAAVLALPATAGFVALAELAFYLLYPSSDDDTLKVVYVVTAIPPLAIAAGWALWRLRERSLPAFSVGVALLLAAALLDVQYLWVDHFIGRLAG